MLFGVNLLARILFQSRGIVSKYEIDMITFESDQYVGPFLLNANTRTMEMFLFYNNVPINGLGAILITTNSVCCSVLTV